MVCWYENLIFARNPLDVILFNSNVNWVKCVNSLYLVFMVFYGIFFNGITPYGAPWHIKHLLWMDHGQRYIPYKIYVLLNYHYSLLGSFVRELTPLNNIFVFILLSYYQAIILHLKCCMTSVKLAKRPVLTYKYWSFQLFVKTMYTVTFAKPYMQNYFIVVI